MQRANRWHLRRAIPHINVRLQRAHQLRGCIYDGQYPTAGLPCRGILHGCASDSDLFQQGRSGKLLQQRPSRTVSRQSPAVTRDRGYWKALARCNSSLWQVSNYAPALERRQSLRNGVGQHARHVTLTWACNKHTAPTPTHEHALAGCMDRDRPGGLPHGGFKGMLYLQQVLGLAPAICPKCWRGARAVFTAMCAGQGPRPCRKLLGGKITHGRPGWHMLESGRRSNRMPCCILAPLGSEKRAKRRCWARPSDSHQPFELVRADPHTLQAQGTILEAHGNDHAHVELSARCASLEPLKIPARSAASWGSA